MKVDAEKAIETDQLHLVSVVEADHLEGEKEHPEAGRLPRSAGAGTQPGGRRRRRTAKRRELRHRKHQAAPVVKDASEGEPK